MFYFIYLFIYKNLPEEVIILVIDHVHCFHRMMESADAIDDSDDEVDYTKMDQGNKKGPVGRWDFDTQEEYSDYMSNKEALPKYVDAWRFVLLHSHDYYYYYYYYYYYTDI